MQGAGNFGGLHFKIPQSRLRSWMIRRGNVRCFGSHHALGCYIGAMPSILRNFLELAGSFGLAGSGTAGSKEEPRIATNKS